MSDNQSDTASVQAFAEALCNNRTLMKLNLSNNGLGPNGGYVIGGAVAKNMSLRTLVLSDNNLCKKQHTIKRLGYYYASKGINAIGVALRMNTQLTALHLGRNSLEDKGTNTLAQALLQSNACNLQALSLRDNGIGPQGAQAVSDYVTVSRSLQYLDLSCNRLGEDGGKFIGVAIGASVSVTQLHLNNNEMGPDSAKVIALALNVNRSLRMLDLSCNKLRASRSEGFDDAGLAAIAKSMRNNTTITKLCVHNNKWASAFLCHYSANSIPESFRGAYCGDSISEKCSWQCFVAENAGNPCLFPAEDRYFYSY